MANAEELLTNDFMPQLTFTGLHERYATSTYGVYHADQALRYSQYYDYDRTSMLEDLGDDVHPVRHMSFTEREIIRPLIVAQNELGDEVFEDEQTINMRAAALLHDIGECKHPEVSLATGCSVGDVSWDLKVEADGANEALIRKYIYSKIYNDLPAELLDVVDDIVDHKEGSFTREAFNAAERLGYYLRGLRAGEVVLDYLDTGVRQIDLRIAQLSKMALKVTSSHRNFLEERQDRFPYLGIILNSAIPLQTAIAEQLSPLAKDR